MRTLASLKALEGARVLLRSDFNVPIKDGVISDDGRIRASLPTINHLRSLGAKVIIVAHLGRPKGERNLELSLAPVARRLSELLDVAVPLLPTGYGPETELHISQMNNGDVLLVENIRFEARETSKNDPDRIELASQLAQNADFFVSDGFGAVHRKHASVYDVAKLLPSVAGFLVEAEVEVLKKLTQNPARPYGVVLGGAKVSDKLGVIDNLLSKVDLLAIGGGMVFTFLAANGLSVGKSLLESDQIERVKEFITRAETLGVKLLLPSDIVVATEFSAAALPRTVKSTEIADEDLGLDIGPESASSFANSIQDCHTLFWNGPMGVFEFHQFSHGTHSIAKALTEVDGLAVVGGGDSAAAVRRLGFSDDEFGYISTGGGASLEYLEGKELPGLSVLSQ